MEDSHIKKEAPLAGQTPAAKRHNHENHNHEDHEGHLHHHDHGQALTSLSTAFVVGTLLNFAFVVVEGVFGMLSGSMGLLSDAGHNLSDAVSLLMAWIAFRLTRVPANKRYTYGFSRSTILVSLLNACILLVAIGMIVVESLRKFRNPQPVDGDTVIWVAAVGIAINFATALLFARDRKSDLNVRGAFLHMAMDALVSVGVVLAGLVIKFTGWSLIDPIIGLVIAVIIFISTWNLLRQSLRLSLDGVPETIDVDEIERAVLSVAGVKAIHHLHIWALGTAENAMTLHVSLCDMAESERVKDDIRTLLKQHNIAHITIETEPRDYVCSECRCEHDG